MRISVIDAKALSKILPRLITDHDQIHIAVAWAHSGKIADQLKLNKDKFKSFTVGLDFCATDPDFIDSLIGVRNAYVFKKSGACFHPKIYLFLTDQKAEAIVGSANFTSGGLGSNFETCLHLICDKSEPVILELLATLQSFAPYRQSITKQIAVAYRKQAEIAASYLRPHSPILPSEKVEFGRMNSDFLRMGWTEFVNAVRNEPGSQFKIRMKLLRYLQTLFAREYSFATLTVSEWKAVAGIMHPDAVADSGLDMDQIGLFGSMQGSGSFTNLIANSDSGIAKAIDCIPRQGPVTAENFDRFCTLFRSAFLGSARMGGVSTATRLLAMKRPDVFVCVNSGNKVKLARALHFAPSTLELENYWARVIEPIRMAKWYNAPRPEGPDAEAWDCRAALVDTVCYESN